MNFGKITLIGLCLLASQSCKNILEEEVVTGITANYYNTPAGIEDGVRAAYEPLRSWYGRERGFNLTTFGTDEFTKGADGDFKPLNDYIPALNTSPSDAHFRETWNFFYQAINTANTVIDRAAIVEGMAEDRKAIRVAEAKFLRAHYYFLLVQTFGPIHLTLTETKEVQTTANRTPVLEVYQAIIRDLEEAEAALPGTRLAGNEYGRAYKGAAQHMLAKVHLTRATVEGNPDPNGDYRKAAEYAKKVLPAPVGTGTYGLSLVPTFAGVFDQDNQENAEVVWAVQYTNDPLTNFNAIGNPAGGGFNNGNNAHLFFLMEYDAGHKGTRRDIANGRPWKRFKPTQYTLNLFDLTRDSRYNASFKQVFLANNPATLAPGMKIGDTAIYLPTFEMPAAVVATKNYRVINPSEVANPANARYFPSLSKFLDPRRISIQDERGSRDFMVARLAETYLIAAEADFKLGNVADAVNAINVVRRRAALPGKEAEMEITAGQLTLDFILDERSRELLGEMHRWFDLTRTNTLIDRVKKYNPDGAPNIQQHHVLRPIPADQLDRVTNKDEFEQNPGY
jgi:hypothetical protein